jgi:hypothetical protein
MPEEAGATAPTSGSVLQNLTAAFEAAAEPATIDNSKPVEPEKAAEEKPAEVETPEDEKPEGDKKPDEEAKPEEEKTEEKPDDKADEAEDDEETVDEDGPDILTREEIEEKFARSNTKALRTLTADYAEALQEKTEQVDSLGGEPFLQPLSKISGILQQPNLPASEYMPFFDGIVEASGADAMGKVMTLAAQLVFNHSDIWTKNPETAEFGKAIESISDRILDQKYGMTNAEILEMKEFAAVGWLDKLKEWTENEFVPQDELHELIAASNNPALKKLAAENRELKRQQEADKASDKGAKATEDQELETSFGGFANNAVETVLEEVVWGDKSRSTFREIKTDSDELKEHKAFFRDVITKAVTDEFHRSPAKSALLKGFREGKQGTSIYRKELADAFADVLKKVEPTKARAESMLTKIYGKNFNAKLIPKPAPTNGDAPKPDAKTEAPLKPTETTNFKPSTGPKEVRDIDKVLEQAFIENAR